MTEAAAGAVPDGRGVYATAPASGLRVTWFGHSSSLVEIDGMRVLVDPVWDQRASPVAFMGPKRFFPPTLALDALPRLDVVLISHDHYDHLGAKTVRQLAGRLRRGRGGLRRWVWGAAARFGVPAEQITELDWTESVEVGGAEDHVVAFAALFGAGGVGSVQDAVGFVCAEGPRHRVYYGADSGWWEGFGEIGAQYAGFDLTMLEIGAFIRCGRRFTWGRTRRRRRLRLWQRRRARGGLLMPIHWGLFNLALHAWKQPMERMVELAEEKGIKLWLPEPGAPAEVAGELRSGWWERAE